jgi:acyl dehydratase
MDPAMTVQLIPAEIRELVGTTIHQSSGVVRQQDFQRWAAAVDDRNPLYFDADYARAAGYRDVVMPPLFLKEVTRGVVNLNDIGPDGISTGADRGLLQIPLCPRRMAGGESMTFYEPSYDGDIITATRILEKVEQKTGRRSGDFVLLTTETTYTSDAGVLLATGANLSIYLPAAPPPGDEPATN